MLIKSTSHHGVTHQHPPTNRLLIIIILHLTVFKIMLSHDFKSLGHLLQAQRTNKGQRHCKPISPKNYFPIHTTVTILNGNVTMATSNKNHTMRLYTYTTNPYDHQVWTFYTSQFLRCTLGRFFSP